jgi:hypothetical protein
MVKWLITDLEVSRNFLFYRFDANQSRGDKKILTTVLETRLKTKETQKLNVLRKI